MFRSFSPFEFSLSSEPFCETLLDPFESWNISVGFLVSTCSAPAQLLELEREYHIDDQTPVMMVYSIKTFLKNPLWTPTATDVIY